MLHYPININIMPHVAVLELSWECTHKCLFCSCPWMGNRDGYRTNGKSLSCAEWIEVFSILRKNGVKTVSLSGGEAVLHPHFIKLLSHAAKMFDRVSLNTNGSEITPDLVAQMGNVLSSAGVSLPGRSVYEYITGGGSMQKAISAITHLSRAGIPVSVNVCVTKPMLPELFDTIAEGILAGASFLLLNRFLPGGRGVQHAAELSLSAEEIRKMLLIAEDALSCAKVPGGVGTELPYCLWRDLPLKWLRCNSGCAGGRDFFAVDPAGNLRPCNHSPKTCGTIWEWQTAIANPEWNLSGRQYLPSMCQGCNDAFRCHGGCREAARIVNGRLDSPDVVFKPCE